MKRLPRLTKRQRKVRLNRETPEPRCATCNRLFVDPEPTFDQEAAKGLSAYEVRERWPRVTSVCKCGATTVRYASYMHYLSGDW